MGKIIIILLFPLFTQAQEIPCFIPVMDTTHYWNYYNKSGSLAWGNVKGYDKALIPKGGKATAGALVNPSFFAIEGYAVLKPEPLPGNPNRMIITQYLNKSRIPIPAPYIIVWPWEIPLNGNQIKQL